MIEPIIGEKQCSKCGECKPRTAFSTDSKGRDGLSSRCKACRNKNARDKVRQRRPDFKCVDRSPTAWLLPVQTSAEAHRLWQRCDVAMGGERRLAA